MTLVTASVPGQGVQPGPRSARAVLRLVLALLHVGAAAMLLNVAWTLAIVAAALVAAGGSLWLGGRNGWRVAVGIDGLFTGLALFFLNVSGICGPLVEDGGRYNIPILIGYALVIAARPPRAERT